MDIGAAISKKIQMAITAKLKELNAYVDDELPDYIMIMVANRKTESQMRDALSLFLSENTDGFTSWLHNLLGTLRRTKTEKRDSVSSARKISESTDVGQEKILVQQRIVNQDEAETEVVAREPVITINPESDDVLDKELQADIPTSKVQHHDMPSLSSSRSKSTILSHGADRQSSSKSISLKTMSTNEKIRNLEEANVYGRDEHHKKRDRKRPKKVSKSSKASLPSTVSQVIQNSLFVSDDDSAEDSDKPKVSSKVAYPKRKMRVPLSKQANKTLLMRAVSEAEKSVRKKAQIPVKQEDEKSSKMETDIAPVRQTGSRQSRSVKGRKKASHRTTKIRRQIDVAESLLKSQKAQNRPKTDVKVISPQEEIGTQSSPTPTVLKMHKNRISVPTTDTESTMLPHFHCDERKFVLQETDSPRDENVVSPIQFDSRHTKRHADAPLQDYVESGKKQRVTARVTPRPHNPNDHVEMTSPPHVDNMTQSVPPSGPVFIVTLDGVVSSKQTLNNASSFGESKVKNKKITSLTAPQSISVAQEAKKTRVLTKLRKQSTEKPVEPSIRHASAANAELEEMKKKMMELQTEAAKLKKLQATLVASKSRQQQDTEAEGSSQPQDQSSVCICNVHYSTTEKQLSDFFSICGKVSRVTLLKDKKTSQPTGYAYLEFESKRAVSSALALNNSRFNNRVIKVFLKQSKQVLPFPASRGMYHARRPRIRGFRGARFRKSVHYTPYGIQKPQARNKTWVNPLLSKKPNS